MIKKRCWLKIQWSYKYVNSKAEETAADVQQADISFFNPLGGKYHRFLDLFVAAVLRILILDPLDISTLNQVSFKMFPIGFSTILPSISSPLSPQGKYHSSDGWWWQNNQDGRRWRSRPSGVSFPHHRPPRWVAGGRRQVDCCKVVRTYV